MTEILFYHLERGRLEDVLPGLLEKTLERGWRAVVQTGTKERTEMLDSFLWTYRDESFLPHAMSGDRDANPVWLTADPFDAEEERDVLFLVDGAAASPDTLNGLERCVMIFDGRDDDALGRRAELLERWGRERYGRDLLAPERSGSLGKTELMSPDDLNTFKIQLQARLEELNDLSVAAADKRKPVELDQQSVGRLSRQDALQQQAMAQAQEARRANEKRKITAALARIAAGEFGWCEECGEAINPKRLQIDPTTQLCVDCLATG